jgi:hypothetical protein
VPLTESPRQEAIEKKLNKKEARNKKREPVILFPIYE